MKRSTWTSWVIMGAAGAVMLAGCGLQATDARAQRHREFGTGGEALVLDDLLAVANDPELSDDEKRAALRRLGLLDEDVIDALLALP